MNFKNIRDFTPYKQKHSSRGVLLADKLNISTGPLRAPKRIFQDKFRVCTIYTTRTNQI